MEIAFLVVFALLVVAGSILQSVILFRALLAATAQVRQDYVDVLLTQKAAFDATLAHLQNVQSVGGTPLQLAVVQHEANRELQLQAATQNYELSRLDIEARRGAAQRPKAVPNLERAMGG